MRLLDLCAQSAEFHATGLDLLADVQFAVGAANEKHQIPCHPQYAIADVCHSIRSSMCDNDAT